MINKIQFKRLVIAAYHLPFEFVRTKKGYNAVQNSGGLVSAMFSLSENFRKNKSPAFEDRIVWVATAEDLPDDLLPEHLDNEYFDITLVKLPAALNELYYGRFCNDLIWPLFHYFPSHGVFDTRYFQAYIEANERFCDEIIKITRPGDFIWVHDYHLMLLPEMIQSKIPEVAIGFFLHIPFPSFESFRLIPGSWREAIIEGITGADLIGFHTHDYTQHFIKSVKMTKGFECYRNIIYTPNKLIKAAAFPIGIDFDNFHSACPDKPVLAEKEIRAERMQNRISSNNVFAWASDFFSQALEIREKQNLTNIRLINKSVSLKIISEYKAAGSRILFLDYDGTLVSFTKYPEQAVIDKKTLSTIKKLSYDPKNEVIIISGRTRDFLEKQFKSINVTLIAEHGFFIKEIKKKWKTRIDTDMRWKEAVLPILKEYVNRCNGTFIEEKAGSIAWHYRNADPDFAQLRLNELRDELSEIVSQETGFEILEGNKVLEVKSGKYDKGEAARSIMKDRQFDFILAAGDDKTDEALFEVLPVRAYTIRIGLTPSNARYNISDYSLFLKILKDLA